MLLLVKVKGSHCSPCRIRNLLYLGAIDIFIYDKIAAVIIKQQMTPYKNAIGIAGLIREATVIQDS